MARDSIARYCNFVPRRLNASHGLRSRLSCFHCLRSGCICVVTVRLRKEKIQTPTTMMTTRRVMCKLTKTDYFMSLTVLREGPNQDKERGAPCVSPARAQATAGSGSSESLGLRKDRTMLSASRVAVLFASLEPPSLCILVADRGALVLVSLCDPDRVVPKALMCTLNRTAMTRRATISATRVQ